MASVPTRVVVEAARDLEVAVLARVRGGGSGWPSPPGLRLRKTLIFMRQIFSCSYKENYFSKRLPSRNCKSTNKQLLYYLCLKTIRSIYNFKTAQLIASPWPCVVAGLVYYVTLWHHQRKYFHVPDSMNAVYFKNSFIMNNLLLTKKT